ncbi:MAG: DUF4249 domain-containing protein [Bacteroidota bacterium]
MRRIKNSIFIFSILLLFACIKSYDPVINSNAQKKYVVSGRITNTQGWQIIKVTLSSPVGAPDSVPVKGCQVTIVSGEGYVFPTLAYSNGEYWAWMSQNILVPGTSYQVKVITPEGDLLQSGFEMMPKGPALDSVYYHIKEVPTSIPGVTSVGMQFYVDLVAVGDYSQYYKWEVTETWEYHAAHSVEYYYDGTFHQVKPPDSTNKICWFTGPVKNIFTVSTKSLSQNIYKQFPLHTVDGHTSRMGIGYSILVRQLALSEKAYNYWEQMRINSNDQGGLYEQQPLAIKGNIINVTHPEKEVLGYFYAVSETTRRYFYKNIPGLPLDFPDGCGESELGRFGWKEFFKYEYPIYYYFPPVGLRILDVNCVDCRKAGGVTHKPDFWPY